jgi:hypothetical protein
MPEGRAALGTCEGVTTMFFTSTPHRSCKTLKVSFVDNFSFCTPTMMLKKWVCKKPEGKKMLIPTLTSVCM